MERQILNFQEVIFVTYTKYEHCALGVGDNYNEALEDALECAAQDGYDLVLSKADKLLMKSPSASKQYPDLEETFYYVGLRWNVSKHKPRRNHA